MQFVDEVKEHMESQDDFGGWDKFGKTWDVDDNSPLVAVKRISSIQTQWNKILTEEAKELPAEEEKKFLTNKLSEKVQERKKEAETKTAVPEEEHKKEEEPKKFLESDLKIKVQERKGQSKKVSFWDKLK